jgi:hypothetical protein
MFLKISEDLLNMIIPTLNSYPTRHQLTRVIPIIAVIGMLAATVFAPNAQARGGYDGEPTVELGTAGNYKILAGAALTNGGATVIYGSIGARAAITNPTMVVTGNTEHANAALEAALNDANTAYNDARSRTSGTTTEISGDLAGRTLRSGVYHFNEAISLSGSTGHLTLDGQYEANSVWIFQGDAAMMTSAGRRIILINSADSNKVFWVVDGAITSGASSVLRGIFISKAAITLGANNEIHGAVMSLDAAVTIDSSIMQ